MVMELRYLSILCLSLLHVCHGELVDVPQKDGSHKYILYSYPEGGSKKVKSEDDLEVCDSKLSACGVLHNRFWFPPKIQLLCRCREGKECVQKHKVHKKLEGSKKGLDNKSMALNNRANLQFCRQVKHENIAECDSDVTGLTEGFNHSSVQVECYCPARRYWERTEDTDEGSLYRCAKLRFCTTGDHCSHIRTDTFASYYHCTCPKNHMCLPKDGEEPHNVTELMYTGTAYKGYCTPVH